MRVDHTAIVVGDLDEAIDRYSRLYEVERVERTLVPGDGVEVAFLSLQDTSLELVCPLAGNTRLRAFLAEHGERLHHLAVEVQDIHAHMERLRADGVRLIDQEPRRGAHGTIAFVHPHGTGGVLLELVEHDGPR